LCAVVAGLFTERKKEEQGEKNGAEAKRVSNIVRLDKPDVACCAKREHASEKCNARREEEKRTSSPSPTNARTTTNGKASNNRPFDCNAFFLRSFHPCDVLSLSLARSLSLACALACPSLCLRYSQLALRLSLSLRAHAHTRTRSVHKDIARRKKRTEEREECRH